MIVRAGTLFDGISLEPQRNVDIVVNGDQIAELRAAGGESDLIAAAVVPGLVNAHVHLEMSGEANTEAMFRATTVAQRALRAVENARKTLHAGVTSVRDLGSSEGIAPALRDAIASGGIPGPAMRAAARVICMTGGHGWFVGRQVDSDDDARKGVREQMASGADCIKLIATGGVLTKGAVPGNAQLTQAEMAAACDEAHRHGLRVGAHAIGAAGIVNAARAGVQSIEHGMLVDDEGIGVMLERDVYLVPTLSAPACILERAEDGGQPDYVIRKAREINEVMVGNLRRARRAGVKIAGGSDAGTPYNLHENYAEEVILMHRLLEMSVAEALIAATATAAACIDLPAGRVQAGAQADLLLLQRDCSDDLTALREPLAVVQRGIRVA